jgi:hypothetical protein
MRPGSKTASMRARVTGPAPGTSKHITFSAAGSVGSSRKAIDCARTSTRSSRSNRSRTTPGLLDAINPLATVANNAAAPRRLSALRRSARTGPAEAYAGSVLTIVPPLTSMSEV